MSKVEVYCKIKKKVVKMDKRLADALVKMKRASYDIKVDEGYPTKMMVAETTTEKPKKSRKSRKKNKKEVVENEQIEEPVSVVEESDDKHSEINVDIQSELDEIDDLLNQKND